jgi:hypothetical protein
MKRTADKGRYGNIYLITNSSALVCYWNFMVDKESSYRKQTFGFIYII